jgi:hypothetical protein
LGIKDANTDNGEKSKAKKKQVNGAYGEEDLHGMKVMQNVADLGSTTILTLADAPLLKTKDDTSKIAEGLNEEEVALENVELTDQQK